MSAEVTVLGNKGELDFGNIQIESGIVVNAIMAFDHQRLGKRATRKVTPPKQIQPETRLTGHG